MTLPIEQFSFLPTQGGTPITGSVKRNFGDWAGDVLNVLDFGADPTGVADSTAAIQACFDAAYGSYTSPHGSLQPGVLANRPVFIPNGQYIVRSSVSTAVSNAVNDGTGKIQLTVGSTAGLATNDIVNVSQVGGLTSPVNQSWCITVNDATHITLQSSSFSGTYTAATGKVVNCALRLRAVLGGHIFGGGRNTTAISNTVADGICLGTNGIGYSVIEGLQLNCKQAGDHGIALDLNWMMADPLGAATQGTQSNQLRDLSIYNGDYGIAIGFCGNMGSENTILNCFVGSCTIAGLITANGNALNNNVYGGNFTSCGSGIQVSGGCIPGIFGVTFEVNTAQDINIINSNSTPSDGYMIAGCRSESTNFIQTPGGINIPISVMGCTQSGGTGFFFAGQGFGIIAGCASSGTITDHGDLLLVGNVFNNANVLSSFGGTAPGLNLRNAYQTQTSDLTLLRWQSGTCFDNAGASANVNLILPLLNNSDTRKAGITYSIYIAAPHEVKFTATNGLKIRDAANLSIANGQIASSTVGDYIEITSTGASGDWVVKAKNGTHWVVT